MSGNTNMGKRDYAQDADTWLKWAWHTHAGAKKLFHDENPFLWFSAAILGHQALEMYLKTILIRLGHPVVKGEAWGHDLVGLASKMSQSNRQKVFGDDAEEFVDKLQVFTNYFNELRYPSKLECVMGLGEEERDLLDELVDLLHPWAAGE